MDTEMIGTCYLLKSADLPNFKPCIVTDVRYSNGMIYMTKVGERHKISPEKFVALSKSKQLLFTATCHLYLEEYTEELKSEPYFNGAQ